MIKLYNIDHFRLEQTFDCGQCFRWTKDGNGVFWGVVGTEAVKMYYVDENTIFVESTNPDLVYWSHYLNFSSDYNKIEEALSGDELLKKAIDKGRGIRIVKQEPWETIVSFIISANNNIPRIKKIIEKLCECFGNKIEFDGRIFYGFPSPETLAVLEPADLAEIKCGFRDKYIIDAAKKVASGEIDLERIHLMTDEDAKKELMKINGVGPKVADCILLFAYQRHKIFPLDVWTKRILKEQYGVEENEEDFIKEKFGNYAGFAQQYLYNYFAVEKES